jgi:short-subunit dehydrogenase
MRSVAAKAVHMGKDLEGAVALVTGASAGIGLAASQKLVARGARVALVARTADKLEQVARDLGPERAAAFALDVSDLGALRELPDRVAARFGRLDVVINNAGTNHRGEVAHVPTEALEAIITTNLTAPIVLMRAALPRLLEAPAGHVINVASLAGMVPLPHEAAYCASKAGLRAFTRALADELRGTRVRASLVSPGPVDTGFFGDVRTVPDLVFSQPMSTAAQVADAVLAVLDSGEVERAVPGPSGVLATMGYVFPSLRRALTPALERLGARNKARYLDELARRRS